MALAAVCSDLHKTDPSFQGAFQGFIVDHGVREGSDEEANKVATELERIGISAKVLRLAWGEQDPKVATNFETLARKLRYRALGTACWDAWINKLLVAHHADDQAETVLSRIVSGYTGTGLEGIKRYSRTPECEGIFGVDASGWRESRYSVSKTQSDPIATAEQEIASSQRPRRAWYESVKEATERGGVFLQRPLLPFTKEQLIEVCRGKAVQWFEDPTNADKTLTQRNTIRNLSRSNAFPVALQHQILLSMAREQHIKNSVFEKEAIQLFQAATIKLHLQVGKATVDIPHEVVELRDCPPTTAYRLKAIVLRKLLLLVAPCSDIELQHLDAAMDLVFPEATPSRTTKIAKVFQVQMGGVNIVRHDFTDEKQSSVKLTLTRAIPAKYIQAQVSTAIPHTFDGYPKWILWDSRYWIRAKMEPKQGVSWQIRFLTPTLLSEIRKRLGSLPGDDILDRWEKWTIPVITGDRHGELVYAGLPSLGPQYYAARRLDADDKVSPLPGGTVDVRYKNVAFKETLNHTFRLKQESHRGPRSQHRPGEPVPWVSSLNPSSATGDSHDLINDIWNGTLNSQTKTSLNALRAASDHQKITDMLLNCTLDTGTKTS
ncbi:hypothetical protein PRZ48_014587 [Zasmidium cellare]|uniref:tRNA(Ile)-lysidine synthetase n=1 Tax=Zasmidium cellare TaxID=395010 RepID=A0ABR0DYP0_ZASCE|nr:hypothetical protein PRZ48_014587 [Zasmidium cellare]